MSVEEVNHELGEAMKGKTLNRDKIVLCQSKITMGLKRKTELNKDLRKLEEHFLVLRVFLKINPVISFIINGK